MNKHNHSAMMITVSLSSSYIFLQNTQIIYNQIYYTGNDEVIFEEDTGEDEYMFSGQGITSSVCQTNKVTDEQGQSFCNDDHGELIKFIHILIGHKNNLRSNLLHRQQ